MLRINEKMKNEKMDMGFAIFDDNCVHILNESAATVFRCCNNTSMQTAIEKSIHEITLQVGCIDVAVLQNDIKECISSLLEKSIIICDG